MWTLWNVPVIPAGVFVDGSLKFTQCLKPLPSSPIHQTTAELLMHLDFLAPGSESLQKYTAASATISPKSGSKSPRTIGTMCMSCACPLSHCLSETSMLSDGLFKCRDAKCLHHGLRRLRLDLHFLWGNGICSCNHSPRFLTVKCLTQDVTFPNIIFLPPDLCASLEGYETWKCICFRFLDLNDANTRKPVPLVASVALFLENHAGNILNFQ